MALDISGWRTWSAYDFIGDLAPPDLAWEWLRRNTDYQRDYAEAERPEADHQRLNGLIRRRWGLRFPC